MHKILGISAAIVLSAVLMTPTLQGQQQAPAQPMSFFITSVGMGNGANLGGLAGADKHCQTLAAAAGAGNRTWRAYMSQTQNGDVPAVNARARIGNGPWYNAKGQLVAANVADLHGDQQRDRNNIRKPTALNEKGGVVNGVGDMPNQHDMLTGSDSTGRALIGRPDVTTCNNWTANGPGNAMLGHHDRLGGPNASWNAVHMSNGCSQENLVSTGGAGLFYCFAAN
ncbi:MAG: lectin [Acidobacteria bacterium]|nr:lectin [Acidobacteriota bacterium]